MPFYASEFGVDLLPQAAKLLFMMTQLFRAVQTVQTSIGGDGETFGITVDYIFPPCQQDQCQPQQAQAIPAADKNHRCPHHGKIPVVNAACGAAAVLHKPTLEGTEKQNTDHVAYGVE